MYSELPPSEKEAWVARAEADKARYLHELAGYVPPPGYDSKGDAIVNPIATKGGRKGKPEKDVNAPKRNVSILKNQYFEYVKLPADLSSSRMFRLDVGLPVVPKCYARAVQARKSWHGKIS